MHRLGVSTAVVVALVALVATAAAWTRTADPVTAEEAVELARDALEEADVAGASIDREPSAGTYQPQRGEPIEVWETVASVDGGAIRLWLARDDGEPVFLDDRGPSGATQLLTEAQFQVLAGREADPARDRLLRENIVVTIAAAAALVVAALLGIAAARRS
jgi:hypothetical protein